MRRFFLLLFIHCIFLACSQGKSAHDMDESASKLISLEGIAMTIPYHIEVVRIHNGTRANDIQPIVDSVFDEINSIYNKWNPHSELSELNRLPAYEPKVISEKLASFLRLTQKFVELSGGRFDPTIEAIQQLWKSHLEKGEIPSDSAIEKLRPSIGWDKIILNERIFMKKNDKVAIDLGGIAKGYAVDLLVEALLAKGYKDIFVEWGGEVHAVGMHPQGRKWAVFIPNLEDLNPEHALAYIPLNNEAIATSGDYLQQWTVKENNKEVTYFHVFDPKTLRPLTITENSIASASCLTKDCTTADALATCLLMCPSIEEARTLSKKLEKRFPNSTFWILSHKDIKH
jgi:FAD:protein FMN transferase